jgi:hypothetical protein
MKLEDLDPTVVALLDLVPKDLPQAQYSTKDQLFVLILFARRLKLYDALELLRKYHFDAELPAELLHTEGNGR